MKAFVLGSGSWGRVLGGLLRENGVEVTLGARDEREVAALRAQGIEATSDRPLQGIDLLVIAVPSQFLREACRSIEPVLGKVPIVSCTKGLEIGTHKRMSEVIAEELPGRTVMALSGPNLAPEIGRGLPASTVIAGPGAEIGQRAFNSDRFRVYTNDDIVGVELGGALKNVIALASGALDGLGLGDNAKAALVTRGLAEISRLGVNMGANPLTFAGLAGMGDLVATCASHLSRNHQVGEMLAQGKTWQEIEPTGITAEGVHTAVAALELSRKRGVEMPIAEQVHGILFEGRKVAQAVEELMGRRPKRED